MTPFYSDSSLWALIISDRPGEEENEPEVLLTSSMHGDLEAGGRLEAPWLAGAVARMARDAWLEAPANRAIYAALKPFVEGRQ